MKNNPPPDTPSRYTSYYGLVREPFGHKIEDDLFYPETTRKQRLDILLHLTQFGNEIMLVTGPAGSGKTTLLQQFQLKALDTWSVARVEAASGIDERQLLQQLYRQMGMEFQGATHAELLEHMQRHFDTLQRSGRLAVMLIDDAEQLTITALKKVLELAAITSADNKPLLRVILFGSGELAAKMDDPQLGHLANLAQRRLDLPPFEQQDTEHYILHRLSASRFAATEPFTVGAMHKIHKLSQGWPGRINQLAHQLLMDTLPPIPLEPDPALEGIPDTPGFPVGRAIAAATFIAVVAAMLIFQDRINQLFEPAEPDTVKLELPTMPADAPMPAPAQPPARVQHDIEAPPRADSELESAITALVSDAETESQATPPTTDQAATPPARQTATGRTTEKPLTPADKPATPPGPAANQAVATAPPAPMKPPTAAAAVAPPRPATDDTSAEPGNLPARREEWLLAQPPGHYTLQVVAGERLTTISKFITEHRLRDDLAFYVSARRGKPWYGLLLGNYPDKKTAIDARARLPRDLRRLKPWVRPLRDVHKDIRRAPR